MRLPTEEVIRRAKCTVGSLEHGDGTKVTWNVTIECDAVTKPFCVAERVTMDCPIPTEAR